MHYCRLSLGDEGIPKFPQVLDVGRIKLKSNKFWVCFYVMSTCSLLACTVVKFEIVGVIIDCDKIKWSSK